MDIRQTARQIRGRITAQPVPVRVALAATVIVGALWLAIAFRSAATGIGEWWSDRAIERIETENAALRGQIQVERETAIRLAGAIEQLEAAIAEKDRALADLRARADMEDQTLDTSRKRYQASRRARARGPVDRDALDRQLRELDTAPDR